MLKLLTRLLLFLSFLLLGGHTHAHHDSVNCSHRKIVESPAQAGLSYSNNRELLSKAGAPGKRHEYDIVKAEEIEDDDDSESYRKFTETGKSYFQYYYARPPGCTADSFHNPLPSREHLSYLSPDKFIIHRSIRI
ncbi:hypothetical protein [Foetidibacter luteolus]|uniref:hypothetical protein n=1 Tax=Foetidibacter luteolus TaxID=2608880 RepID=UPI00129A34F4|nr:hypothetical protein [Foetidibacter luteolus]